MPRANLAAMHALQVLAELNEKGVWDAEPTTSDDPVFVSCLNSVGKGLLEIAQQTTNPNAHSGYVELHEGKTERYCQDGLLPLAFTDKQFDQTLISFEVPDMRSSLCHPDEDVAHVKTFGRDGLWLREVVLDILNYKTPNQEVSTRLILGDTWLGHRETLHQHSYIALTITPTCFYGERVIVSLDMDKVLAAATRRSSREELVTIKTEAVMSSREVKGLSLEDDLSREQAATLHVLHSLPKLSEFLQSFAEAHSRLKKG